MNCLGKIQVAFLDEVHVIKLCGDIRLNICPALEEYLEELLNQPKLSNIVIDLTDVKAIDSTALGQLAKISIRTQERFHFMPSLAGPNANIARLLESMGFQTVFHIMKESYVDEADFEEWVAAAMSEDEARLQVIAAHRVLMNLNDKNKAEFRELVNTLEAEQNCHKNKDNYGNQ